MNRCSAAVKMFPYKTTNVPVCRSAFRFLPGYVCKMLPLIRYYCPMAKQRSGVRTAVIALGILTGICNVAALYMYAVEAPLWYRHPHFIQTAMALSPAIGSTHRGEWGVHWGYGEWLMLAGGVLHLAGLLLYGGSGGAYKVLLYAIYSIIAVDSLYFIFYFLILQPRSVYFVLPGTQPLEFWLPLIIQEAVRVCWLLLAAATIMLLAAGDERVVSS